MKILITGGLGYIGSHTATLFAQSGYDVVILDNLSNSNLSVLTKIQEISGKMIPFYNQDIRDKVGLEKVFKEQNIDGIIHFAAKKAVGESCQIPFEYYDNNIVGSLCLFELMIKYDIKNIVFSSSATVYDPNGTPPFLETDRLNTTNPYGTTKLVMEYLLKDMSTYKGFNTICLRYFNPIGAHPSGLLGENPNGIPNNLLPFIYKVATGELGDVKVFGNDYPTPDGTGIRDYIHVMDLAEAHIAAYKFLEEKTTKSKENMTIYDAINIGTGQGTSVLEMINMVKEITQKDIPYSIVERRSGDVAVSLANPDKANSILGRKATRSVKNAIQDGWIFIKTT